MADNSKIQWTEATWNPWHGCKKVSPGCKFCYMYRDKDRYKQDPTTVLRSKTKFNDPLKWSEPRLIFTCSWSDWFIEDADPWREAAWDIIRNTPRHTYQILTKRPERILQHLPADWGDGYPNVWLGVSLESKEYLHRVGMLAEVPAAVRFVSAEPLIGEVSLFHITEGYAGAGTASAIDWLILGGESGNEEGKWRYRPAKPSWFESLIYEARALHIPVFMKQTGTHIAKALGLSDRHGGNLDEWPEPLRVREMPKNYQP